MSHLSARSSTAAASHPAWRTTCTWLVLALAIELGMQVWGTLRAGVPPYFAPVGMLPSVAALGLGWLLALALLGGPAPSRLGLTALARAELMLAAWLLLTMLAGTGLELASASAAGIVELLGPLLAPVLVPAIAWRWLRTATPAASPSPSPTHGRARRRQPNASRARVKTWLALLVVLQLVAALAAIALSMWLVLAQSHSERVTVPYEPPWLLAPDLREESWPETGTGYVVFSDLRADDPQNAGLRALASRRAAKEIVQLPRPPGGRGLEAWLVAELDRLKPRHVLFVAPPSRLEDLVPVANRVICDARGPRAGYGFLPAGDGWDLQAYAARVEAREVEPDRSARGAVIVVEVGRFISPLCHAQADHLGSALGQQGVPSTVIRYDNSLASRLEVSRAAPLLDAGILLLIGHGDGTYAAGVQAANLPKELRGHPVVVNGACSGGAVALPGSLARTLFSRGALLQAAGTSIHGWVHVAPFLEHAWCSGRSAGEAWARAMVELRRAADADSDPDLAVRLVASLAGVTGGGAREVFEQSILIGDPALIPFPADASGRRGSLLAR